MWGISDFPYLRFGRNHSRRHLSALSSLRSQGSSRTRPLTVAVCAAVSAGAALVTASTNSNQNASSEEAPELTL